MLHAAIQPPPVLESVSGTALAKERPADLPGISSIKVTDLFDDIPREIYLDGPDLSPVRHATEKALAKVDMSMIKPEDSVNVACSEHGFILMGGGPYAEMLRTVRDVVMDRTGCKRVRLRLCVGINHTEAEEILDHYKLGEYYEGRVKSGGPFDKGVAIETEIGTLYGLKSVYDADWFIHCHYDDPREVYLHRLITRSLKAFTMSYARFETRSVFHMNFGARSSNIVPRAIYESPFVQGKHAFTCFLATSPAGVTGVDADNDLIAMDKRLTVNTLKGYGKILRLFAAIDECVAVLDGGRWSWYLHAGGVASCNLYKAPGDYLDLNKGPKGRGALSINRNLKALVVNQVWGSLLEPLSIAYPVYTAGEEVTKGLPSLVSQIAHTENSLSEAIAAACQATGTDKVIVFDDLYGSINLSPSLAQFLFEKAPEISEVVDKELLPMWLQQRGLSLEVDAERNA